MRLLRFESLGILLVGSLCCVLVVPAPVLLLARPLDLAEEQQILGGREPSSSESEEVLGSEDGEGEGGIKVVEESFPDFEPTESRAWRDPKKLYQAQLEKTDSPLPIGYNEKTFSVPKSLQPNYQFWLKIYTQFTTDQGIFHDAEKIHIEYGQLDFSTISRQADLSPVRKELARKKMAKEFRKGILAQLDRCHQALVKGNSNLLNAEDRRIYDLFASDADPKKFLKAKDKKRLRFQLGQKDRIVQGIFFSGRYLEEFEEIFRAEGVPLELSRLAFVESSFNVLARSKVGASGLWQIMPSAARGSLKMNPAVDKRNYPRLATQKAAQILRFNYNLLKDWPLAITGYNHGPHGVARLLKFQKVSSLDELVENVGHKKRLGFASRNFYASFLAALEAERNANQYFGESIRWSKPLEAKEIKISFPIYYRDILDWFDGDSKRAELFNPHIMHLARKNKIPIPRETYLMVPARKVDEIQSKLSSFTNFQGPRSRKPSSGDPATERSTEPQSTIRAAASSTSSSETYTVQKGDSIWSIAREFGLSRSELLRANPKIVPELLKVGDTLIIP